MSTRARFVCLVRVEDRVEEKFVAGECLYDGVLTSDFNIDVSSSDGGLAGRRSREVIL